MSKSKLPSDRAFPITVSKLREKLTDTPQCSEISIEYSYYKPMTARRLRKTVYGKSRKPADEPVHEILSASYRKSEVSLSTPNDWQEEDSWMNTYTKHKWQVRLRGIPLTELKLVRDLLEKEGYAKLKNWFASTNKFAGKIGMHRFEISLHVDRLTYKQFDSA